MSGGLQDRMAAATRDKRVIGAIRLATWRKVEKRETALATLPHADDLRARAARIRRHTIEHLPRYLGQFAERVAAAGGHVHFAANAAVACQIITKLAAARALRLAVKSKSMTSEEIHLNAALEAQGVQVVETDLGEFIVQIDRDRPSHIITPIIHKDRKQVAEAMVRELGCEYSEDPQVLSMIARHHLRDIFRRCDLGISGVNFGIAESGTLCLITNEGNGRLTTTRPRVHVALMGIEKVIPRLTDLPVFLKLISRASGGQAMSVYTTLITGPRKPSDRDGPEELHVVIMDNGRSGILNGPAAEVLSCIRCGACLNACPVYRNTGGHAYDSVYPGPIGALITPLLFGPAHAELPRASSLCGACKVACPVNIDIPALLVRLRHLSHGQQPWSKRLLMQLWSRAMSSPTLYRWGQYLLRGIVADDGTGWATRGPGPLGAWTTQRDLLRPAARSFRERWREELRDDT